MNPDSKLEDAIILASLYYKDSIDCDGQPCIMHLLRVMLDVPKELDYQVTALLHDLPLRFDYSLDDIREEFGDKAADALEILNSISSTESYRNYLKRVINNDIARTVKIIDLKDEIKMLDKIAANDIAKQKVYENALQILGG